MSIHSIPRKDAIEHSRMAAELLLRSLRGRYLNARLTESELQCPDACRCLTVDLWRRESPVVRGLQRQTCKILARACRFDRRIGHFSIGVDIHAKAQTQSSLDGICRLTRDIGKHLLQDHAIRCQTESRWSYGRGGESRLRFLIARGRLSCWQRQRNHRCGLNWRWNRCGRRGRGLGRHGCSLGRRGWMLWR